MTDSNQAVSESLSRLATYAARVGPLPYIEGRAFDEIGKHFTDADTAAVRFAAINALAYERIGVLTLTMSAVLARLGELERRLVEESK